MTVHHGGQAVLADVSLVIGPGEHVAVVGVSGAGKSTLLEVILGVTEPTTGSITWSPAAPSADQIAWVAPGTRLWNDSLVANVAYGAGRGAADPDARMEAAGIGDLASRAGERVGANGSMLSDGEVQRVRVARALGRPQATVVVLDEPFRGLEARRRQHLLAALRQQWAHATLVCALHEIGDTLTFDKIVVVDRGRITAHGPPAELIADPTPTFAAMVARSALPPWDGWQVHDLGQVAEVAR